MENKVVLVTGASSGIGSATAKLFAKNHYNIVLQYHQNEEKAQKLAEEIISTYQVKVLKIKVDITKEEDILRMKEEIKNTSLKLTGIINGYDYKKGLLTVEGISNTATVNNGDYVYTSGLGGVFPSGILIGRVEGITTDDYDLSKIINVKPSAKFDDINFVTVLKRNDAS